MALAWARPLYIQGCAPMDGSQIVLGEVLLGRPLACQLIEDGVPDVPDGLIQLIHGVADLATRPVIAHQPQRGLQILWGSEMSAAREY